MEQIHCKEEWELEPIEILVLLLPSATAAAAWEGTQSSKGDALNLTLTMQGFWGEDEAGIPEHEILSCGF